jgi:copper homeostasis protein CutC
MADPAAMSIPRSTILRPRSVQFCFMTDEMTMGASWLSTIAFMRSVPAIAMSASLPASDMATRKKENENKE